MYKEFYQASELLGFPMFALFFFVGVFTGITFLTLRRRNATRFDSIAHLPLADDSEVTSAGGARHVH